jgi:hypothetical protein
MSGTRLQGAVMWPINYAALLQFKEKYGHCNVPQSLIFECELPGMGENGAAMHYSGE